MPPARNPRRNPSEAVQRPNMPAAPDRRVPQPDAPAPRPKRVTRRYTVDLDERRHQQWRRWAFDTELDASALFFGFLDLVAEDPSVRVRVEALAADLTRPKGPRPQTYGPPDDPVQQWTSGGHSQAQTPAPAPAPRARR